MWLDYHIGDPDSIADWCSYRSSYHITWKERFLSYHRSIADLVISGPANQLRKLQLLQETNKCIKNFVVRPMRPQTQNTQKKVKRTLLMRAYINVSIIHRP